MNLLTATTHRAQNSANELAHSSPYPASEWPAFCGKVKLLSQDLQKGAYIEQGLYNRIQKQLSQFLKQTSSPEAQAQLREMQKKFTEARAESLKTCLNNREKPYEPFVFTPAQNPQKSCKSTLLHVLRLAGFLLSPQQAAIDLSRGAVQPFTALQSAPLNPVWQTIEPQCVSLKQRESHLIESFRDHREELTGPDQDLSRYGNKHANLIKMAKLDHALDLNPLEIPLPQGIAHEETMRILGTYAPEVFTQWAELQKKSQLPGFSLDLAEIKYHLHLIDQAIGKAFSHPEAFKMLSTDMQSWLQKQHKEGTFLMVRSTGAEDSHQMANAGGNLSRAYVSASPEEVMEAVGSVVQSYFSENSLRNRLNGKINPFSESLQLSVTTQALIGEPVGGAKRSSDIPVSFVGFSQEPIYVGEEKFRAMRVSLSFGHGEGVVGEAGIATDSVLILHSESNPEKLLIIYNNQIKRERLAPVKVNSKVLLKKIENPPELHKLRSLGEKEIAQLYSHLSVLETYFSHPTDVEGVFKNGKFYFVQARPVNRKALSPTYLKDVQGVTESIQAEILVPGQASIVSITDERLILIAPTLKEAEELFKKDLHKLVIVQQSEPQNSHPVVNFSSLGIPCLYIKSLDVFNKMLDQVYQDHTIAVCMQTGTISLWDNAKGALKEAIVEGFAVHPAQIAISLDVEDMGFSPLAEVPSDFKEQIIEARKSIQGLQKLKEHPLLKDLKNHLAVLQKELSAFPKKVKQAHQIKNILKELDRKIEESFAELEMHSRQGSGHLEKLLHFKILESLLIGPVKENSAAQYSLLQANLLGEEASELINYQKQFSHSVRLGDALIKGKRAAPEEAYANWKRFLTEIEKATENKTITQGELKIFSESISFLAETGSLPYFITLFPKDSNAESIFNWIPFYPKESHDVALFRKTVKENTLEVRTLVKDLSEKQKQIRQMTGQMNRFSNPDSFPAAWDELQLLIAPFHNPEWLHQWKTSPDSIRLSAYRVMEQAVNLLDTSLKTIKTSRFTDKEKAVHFKAMLQPYFKIMQNWALELVPEQALQLNRFYEIKEYLAKTEEILQKLDPDQERTLFPSEGFSVSAAILSSGASFDRNLPRTLEDMLTLLHQNSLSWTSILNKQILSPEVIRNSQLPKELQETMGFIEKIKPLRHDTQLIGFELGENQIKIGYNLPLREHSSQIDLIYDFQSKKMIFQSRFLGVSEKRWQEIVIWLKALHQSKMFTPYKSVYQNERELTFSWEIKPNQISSVLEEYSEIIAYTMYPVMEHAIENLYKRSQSKKEFSLLVQACMENHKLMSESFLREYLEFTRRLKPEEAVEKLITLVEKGLTSDKNTVFPEIINLFKKGIGISKAIELTKKNLHKKSALIILELLIKSNKEIDSILIIAQENLNSLEPSNQILALNTFKHLVDQNIEIEINQDHLENIIKSTNHEVQYSCLRLIEFLIKKDSRSKLAKDMIQKQLTLAGHSPQTRSWILRLLIDLINHDQAFESVCQALFKTLSNELIESYQLDLQIIKFRSIENFDALQKCLQK